MDNELISVSGGWLASGGVFFHARHPRLTAYGSRILAGLRGRSRLNPPVKEYFILDIGLTWRHRTSESFEGVRIIRSPYKNLVAHPYLTQRRQVYEVGFSELAATVHQQASSICHTLSTVLSHGS